MQKILIIDDDIGITKSLGLYLEKSDFQVFTCFRWDEAEKTVQKVQPDIIILDINLPGKDGMEVCKEIRKKSQTPILMLSARGKEDDRIEGLENGADDYVPKPFSPREVLARISSILKRNGVLSGEIVTYKDIHLDENNLTITRDQTTHTFTKSEFFLLKKLIEHPGSVVTRQNLMEEIMGYSNYVYDRTIDTHMKNIRKKIGDDIIITVRWVGYKSY